MGYLILFFLISVYVSLLMFCQYNSKKTIFTPEFVFLGGFLPQFMIAVFYVEKWDLILSIDTVMVYVFGGIIFVIFSMFFREVISKNNNSNCRVLSKSFVISQWKLIAMIIIQFVSIVLMARTLQTITGQLSVSEAIAFYNIASKEFDMVLPGLPGKLNLFSYISGYVWMYYFIYLLVFWKGKGSILIILNLILSFINNFLTGSRGGIIQNVIFGLFLFYFLWSSQNQWRKISCKVFLKIVTFGCLIVVLFPISLQWAGRTTSVDKISDYFAMYFSAEMKNLDINIRKNAMSFRNFEDSSTLSKLVNLMGKVFGLTRTKSAVHRSVYHVINGYELGNVSTIYNAFIADLHYFGLIVFEGIMALLSQYSYTKVMASKNIHYILDFNLLFYVFILCKLLFGFFSNWFFDDLFSGGFLWTVFFWVTLRFFLENNFLSRRIKVFGKFVIIV